MSARGRISGAARPAVLTVAVALALLALSAIAAAAQAAPRWDLRSTAHTTAQPGSTLTYVVYARNDGDEPTAPGACPGPDCQSLEMELPPGLTAVGVTPLIGDWSCAVTDSQRIDCSNSETLQPLSALTYSIVTSPQFAVDVAVAPDATGDLTARLAISGGGARDVTIHDPTAIGPDRPFGIDAFDGSVTDLLGDPVTAAGGHPDVLEMAIDFNHGRDATAGGLTPGSPARRTVVDLPPGLVGNPAAAAKCTLDQLANVPSLFPRPFCPSASQVGVVDIEFKNRELPSGLAIPRLEGPVSVFNMVAPAGVAARLGFNVLGSMVILDARVRGGSDYGVTVSAADIPEALRVIRTRFEIWGVPADPVHDAWRGCPGERLPIDDGPTVIETGIGNVPPCSGAYERPAPPRAFFRLPTACGEPGTGLTTRLRAESWTDPGVWEEASFVSHLPPGHPAPPELWGDPVGVTRCADVPFDPQISVAPTTSRADSPSGLSVELEMPQEDIDDPDAVGHADLRRAVVTLPEGMSVNPSSADGLGACSPAQIGLLGTDFPEPAPIRFTDVAPACPSASKIGSVEIETPLLETPIAAGVYLAKPNDNPFDSLLALYIAGRDPVSGVVLKLAGRVTADARTGRLVTLFDNQPQVPFSRLRLELFDGPRAALRTPETCGTYTVVSKLSPWSADDPSRPTAAETVTREGSFAVDSAPDGGPCAPAPAALPFAPALSAGLVSPVAGSHSPFVLDLSRPDGHQELDSLEVTTPAGFAAVLKGVEVCSDAAAPAAACPASSRVGSVAVGAGAGPNPFFVRDGEAFLAGPYKGGSHSLVVEVPAIAGPFDLGMVTVRSAIHIDPTTAQVRVASDPFPRILEGIPLRVRDVRVNVDRPGFAVAPTSCEEMRITSVVRGANGKTATPSDRFQVGDCARLGFKPRLAMRLSGRRMTSGANPAFKASLKQGSGQANIKRARVTLPRDLILDPDRAQDRKLLCPYDSAQAVDCPASSIVGSATAVSPLLNRPLRGPVYFVQGIRFGPTGNRIRTLPTLLMKLRGEIALDLRARSEVDKANRLVSTFPIVPDARVSSFTLRLKGGPRKGILAVAETARGKISLCRAKQTADMRFVAHNDRVRAAKVAVRTPCAKSKKRLRLQRPRR